jgi:hypothetical protein
MNLHFTLVESRLNAISKVERNDYLRDDRLHTAIGSQTPGNLMLEDWGTLMPITLSDGEIVE